MQNPPFPIFRNVVESIKTNTGLVVNTSLANGVTAPTYRPKEPDLI